LPKRGSSPSPELRTRVRTAAIAAIVVLGLTWLGGAWFALLVLVAALLMAREWVDIAHDGDVGQFILHAVAGVSALLAASFLGTGSGGIMVLALLLVVMLAWLASIVLRAQTWRGFTLHHVLGPLYLAGSAFALVALRLGQPEHCGLHAILLLFAIIWSADTLAYFTGRALGGPKLAPRISPNKTISGLLGAIGGGALGAWLFGLAAGWPAVPLALLGAVLGGAGQMGDLFESALKRRFGVKDSGTILPGHGGVLDRVDALVAAAMLALAWGMLITGSVQNAACGVLLWSQKA